MRGDAHVRCFAGCGRKAQSTFRPSVLVSVSCSLVCIRFSINSCGQTQKFSPPPPPPAMYPFRQGMGPHLCPQRLESLWVHCGQLTRPLQISVAQSTDSSSKAALDPRVVAGGGGFPVLVPCPLRSAPIAQRGSDGKKSVRGKDRWSASVALAFPSRSLDFHIFENLI